jgi:hypothetical protein
VRGGTRPSPAKARASPWRAASLRAKDHCHDHADADAEGERQHDARDGDLGAERDAGVGQREDVGGRGEEEEGDGRPQPGALAVDAGEQRLHGAGADGEQAAGAGGGRVGHPARRIGPEEARDRCCGISAESAPAMKKAGTRHSSTCAAR